MEYQINTVNQVPVVKIIGDIDGKTAREIQDIMSVTGFLGHLTICATVEEGLGALG